MRNIPGGSWRSWHATPAATLEALGGGRSIAWFGRNRQLAKDYERKVQTSECLVKVAMIRIMLKRLGGG